MISHSGGAGPAGWPLGRGGIGCCRKPKTPFLESSSPFASTVPTGTVPLFFDTGTCVVTSLKRLILMLTWVSPAAAVTSTMALGWGKMMPPIEAEGGMGEMTPLEAERVMVVGQ